MFRFPRHLRPLRPLQSPYHLARRLLSTGAEERKSGSFYISNVFPVRLGYWDPRWAWATLREETLMERLADIGAEVTGHGFKVESWEVARKDGGVFLHFTYVPPKETEEDKEEEKKLETITALPPQVGGPGKLFLPQLIQAAEKHGGFPSWLGQWYASRWGKRSVIPGHTIYGADAEPEEIQWRAGQDRAWIVKGRQWTEDMNRYPSNRLRVEFDGPDVSQEMIYTLFRPYGRLRDIEPAQSVPSGSLRYATVGYSTLLPAVNAINCLHGYSTPTNTADFTLKGSGQSTDPIPLSRLRLYYDRPLKAHAVREWVSSHPRIVLPLLAFLFGTLSYTFFDPIRAFFVRSQVEDVFNLDKYSVVRAIRSKLSTGLSLFSGSDPEAGVDSPGESAWKDREEAEKSIEGWLSEYPGTFITITGPKGSGKVTLVNRVLKQQNKPSMVIDCSEMAKSKTDATLISSLANQTGYWPVFSFLSSLNNFIDLAAVGLIGQKAGFSAPIDETLRGMLDVVGGALKDVSNHYIKQVEEAKECARDQVELAEEKARRRERIMRGTWHDGRLDCVAGNGIMSELGLGDEPESEGELEPLKTVVHAVVPEGVSSPSGEPLDEKAIPPNSSVEGLLPPGIAGPQPLTASENVIDSSAEIDSESETIKSLPIVVLKNFAQKSARGDLWNVLAEWGAGLIENRVAHVIVVTEGPTAAKSLNKALPTKPLNSIGLADADEANSLAYVQSKLAGASQSHKYTLSPDDQVQVHKLGGRMIDLETLVYKVRTGSTIADSVDDIIIRNVVELRKAAFGDDAQDAKSLPWSRAQAWKIVSELAKGKDLAYGKLLQEFPFKGAESSLKALEEHELVSISYIDGRPSKVRPGKPVFRYAFASLVGDDVFRASTQIDYNNAVIAKVESDIKACEDELTALKNITTNGGSEALGVEGGFLGVGKSNAIRDRAKWLLEKMNTSVEKLSKLEKDNEANVKVLSSGKA